MKTIVYVGVSFAVGWFMYHHFDWWRHMQDAVWNFIFPGRKPPEW
jgi:hypothetical protein